MTSVAFRACRRASFPVTGARDMGCPFPPFEFLDGAVVRNSCLLARDCNGWNGKRRAREDEIETREAKQHESGC